MLSLKVILMTPVDKHFASPYNFHLASPIVVNNFMIFRHLTRVDGCRFFFLRNYATGSRLIQLCVALKMM